MKIDFIKKHNDAIEPVCMTQGSAGYDIFACIIEPLVVTPGSIVTVPTGIALEGMPSNVECQIRPRSGLAFKHGVTVLNTPGTVDSDYKGEIKVMLINHGPNPFIVNKGDRIAQLVFNEVLRPILMINTRERGEDGFGSTGTQ